MVSCRGTIALRAVSSRFAITGFAVRGNHQLTDSLLEAQFCLELDNDISLINSLVSQFERLMTALQFGDPTERGALGAETSRICRPEAPSATYARLP